MTDSNTFLCFNIFTQTKLACEAGIPIRLIRIIPTFFKSKIHTFLCVYFKSTLLVLTLKCNKVPYLTVVLEIHYLLNLGQGIWPFSLQCPDIRWGTQWVVLCFKWDLTCFESQYFFIKNKLLFSLMSITENTYCSCSHK